LKLKLLVNTPFSCYKKDLKNNYELIKTLLSNGQTGSNGSSMHVEVGDSGAIGTKKFCVMLLEKIYKQDQSIVEKDLTNLVPLVVDELSNVGNKFQVEMLVSAIHFLCQVANTELVKQANINERVVRGVLPLKSHHKRVVRRFTAYLLSLWMA
jgi:hypothetical protein